MGLFEHREGSRRTPSWMVKVCLAGLVWSISVNAHGQDAAPPKPAATVGTIINQDLGIAIEPPANWVAVEVTGSAKTLASFIHPESQSQIEVIGTPLMNSEVADIFFDTFRDSLKNAEFVELKAPSEQTIGTLRGNQSEYTFEHTGILLSVVVFSFIKDDAAFLVVGYFKEDERSKFDGVMKRVIENLTFS